MDLHAVLFDLDGTLIDHFTTIHRCINYAEDRLGLKRSSYGKVRCTVGGSIIVTMTRLVGEDLAEEGVKHFRTHFDEIWKEDLHVLPGARWILESLRNRGLKTAVFTNKHGAAARDIVKHLELGDVVEFVAGTVDTPWRKPQPEFTGYVLEHVGATPQTAVLVGDSPFDAETANAVGMGVYLVSTGSHTLEQLREVPCRGAYENLFDLGLAVFGLQMAEV